MSVLTILTILSILIIGASAALLLSYVIVPRNFRTYNNYSVRVPKVYKHRSRRR